MRSKKPLVISALTAVTLAGLAASRSSAPAVIGWNLVGWNDLGMHCMDADYSVFSILPPFNTIQAQLMDAQGNLVANLNGITVTYEAVADPEGSINKSSIGKTNYWAHVNELYGGSSTPNTGLAGHDMPGPANTPQPMAFNSTKGLFHAEGIPITPFDDLGRKRTYPMMRLTARSGTGAVLATTDIVLPVSDEMDCSLCHASDSGPAAQPGAGWVHDGNFERDYRLNILRLHDERQASNPAYAQALHDAHLSQHGLFDTATSMGRSVLCASCHASNALPGTGLAGISALTSAMHAGHSQVIDPVTNQTLDSGTNRASCYRCHPGSDTRCLRGAMGASVAADATLQIQCQNCHGNMSAVGDPVRVGWLDQPSCQNCHTGTATHNNGEIRYTSALDQNGQRRAAVDATFATNDDVPGTGFNLYRFSAGHGGLACEACHGSTHAVFPAAHGNDNLQSQDLQGHIGTLVECTACHAQMPQGYNGGPHGMHPIGANWAADHADAVEQHGSAGCLACHGGDGRGTVLSQMQADRTISMHYGTRSFWRGQRISCYECHNGPSNNNNTPDAAPVVQDGSGATSDQPITINLIGSDANNDPLTFRVVHQPAHGMVGIVGNVATYRPEPGFAGLDTFSFAANDGRRDSNLGTVTVTRGATSAIYGRGYPGTNGTIPGYDVTAAPVLGSNIGLTIGNSSGQSTAMGILMSGEPARISTGLGGVLLVLGLDGFFGTLPAGGTTLSVHVPNSTALLGANLYMQMVQADAGARFGIAFSRGLRLTFGN